MAQAKKVLMTKTKQREIRRAGRDLPGRAAAGAYRQHPGEYGRRHGPAYPVAAGNEGGS